MFFVDMAVATIRSKPVRAVIMYLDNKLNLLSSNEVDKDGDGQTIHWFDVRLPREHHHRRGRVSN